MGWRSSNNANKLETASFPFQRCCLRKFMGTKSRHFQHLIFNLLTWTASTWWTMELWINRALIYSGKCVKTLPDFILSLFNSSEKGRVVADVSCEPWISHHKSLGGQTVVNSYGGYSSTASYGQSHQAWAYLLPKRHHKWQWLFISEFRHFSNPKSITWHRSGTF